MPVWKGPLASIRLESQHGNLGSPDQPGSAWVLTFIRLAGNDGSGGLDGVGSVCALAAPASAAPATRRIESVIGLMCFPSSSARSYTAIQVSSRVTPPESPGERRRLRPESRNPACFYQGGIHMQ